MSKREKIIILISLMSMLISAGVFSWVLIREADPIKSVLYSSSCNERLKYDIEDDLIIGLRLYPDYNDTPRVLIASYYKKCNYSIYPDSVKLFVWSNEAKKLWDSADANYRIFYHRPSVDHTYGNGK